MLKKLENTYKKNGFIFKAFTNSIVAEKSLMKDIGIKEDITVGGSMTIKELDFFNKFKSRGNKIAWHWEEDGDEKVNKDVYLTSSNAITEDGKLVNMDGAGNRVSSMIIGYKKVFIIIGKNKLVKDYDEAIDRIRNVAAPLNAKRLNVNTPCVKTGKCEDCNSKERICRAETIIHKNPSKTQIYIYYIDEVLGY